jgi:uncharacterized membrane protein YdjX (TVP38/TMEM64 family)
MTDSRRTHRLLQVLALALAISALVLFLRTLPMEALVGALRGWIESLGAWGPLVFAAVYAVWAVLFLPGAALTLVGGALFGLGVGTATVLSGATVGAALSFLIGRYLAREKVERFARSNRKFAAIDRAIENGGWRIVAMLRLSPAVPFNVQNYLYGVTAIRFWPCVLTSFVFMLPGTFLYVYLGHLAGQGLAVASGEDAGRPFGQWILLGVGLLATVAVTVYVTKLAQRALAEQAELPTEAPATAEKAPASMRPALVRFGLAGLLFAAALYAQSRRVEIQRLFGPPPAELGEAYSANPGGATFDHAAFDALLRRYVDGDGFVDYRGLQGEHAALDGYIAAVGAANFDALTRDEKLALLINGYNAFTLRLILDHYPIDSIRSIPDAKRWNAKRWTIAGRTYSLDQIEHELVRPKFSEPRIHFALVCAAVGCPKLRNEAFTGERLEDQLEVQTREVHAGGRWFDYEPGSSEVRLTRLYDWYGGDFKQQAGSVLAFAARYSPELKRTLDAGKKPKVRWLDYDWSLNEQR